MNGKESLYRGKMRIKNCQMSREMPGSAGGNKLCWKGVDFTGNTERAWLFTGGFDEVILELYKQAVRVHFMPFGVRSHWYIGNLRMRKRRRKIGKFWISSLLRRHFAMPQYLCGWVNFLKFKRKGAQKRFVSLVITDTHYLKAMLLRVGVGVHAQGHGATSLWRYFMGNQIML